MSTIKPLSPEKLKPFKFLLDLVEKNMGFVPNSMKTMARIPGIMGSFGTLGANIIGNSENITPLAGIRLAIKNMGWTAKNMKRQDKVPLYLKNLVSHISSKASGCLYCQAHTIGEAANHGASTEQLEAIWEFETSPLFDAKEKAALAFGFAAGCVPNGVTSEHFVELRKHFSEEQIIELGATIALFGFLNRWNDTFATQLETPAIANAEKYLGKSGWEIGKHKGTN